MVAEKEFFIALSRRIVVFSSAITRLQKRLALGTSLHKKRHLEVFVGSPMTFVPKVIRGTLFHTKQKKKLGSPNGVPSFFGCGEGI